MRGRVWLLAIVAVIPVVIVVWLGVGWVNAWRNQDIAIDDWVAQADQICQEAQERSDANPAPQSPLPGDKLRVTAQRSRDELDRLRDIAKPAERKQAVADYLLALEHRSDELVNYADALDKTPAQGPLPDRTHLEELTNDAYTKGFALGLDHCSGGIDFTLDTTTTTVFVPETTTPVPTAIGGQPENEDNTQDEQAPPG